MSIKIYSNQHVTGTVDSMIKSGRLAHSFLLYGDSGLGKKTIAKYFAMKIMCEGEGEKPCRNCVPCRNIIKDIHPDVIWVEHSGKLQGFSAETIRNLCMDAFITPNNSDRKIYILADADNITVQAQNALLKLIEEPPGFTYFIFTAKAKNVFLPTIISRIISLGVSECTEQDCRSALAEMNFSEADISEAVSCFSGNIGMCINYLRDEKLKNTVKLTKTIIDAIINKNEYKLIVSFASVENDRTAAKTVLIMMDRLFRDTLTAGFSKSFISCYPDGAVRLSERITSSGCERLHTLVQNAVMQIDSNVNLKLVLSALCGEITETA